MSKCFKINLVAFYRRQLVMGIGVVTVKSGLIQSSKKCFLELAFNKNSTPLPPPQKKRKPTLVVLFADLIQMCLHLKKIRRNWI